MRGSVAGLAILLARRGGSRRPTVAGCRSESHGLSMGNLPATRTVSTPCPSRCFSRRRCSTGGSSLNPSSLPGCGIASGRAATGLELDLLSGHSLVAARAGTSCSTVHAGQRTSAARGRGLGEAWTAYRDEQVGMGLASLSWQASWASLLSSAGWLRRSAKAGKHSRPTPSDHRTLFLKKW